MRQPHAEKVASPSVTRQSVMTRSERKSPIVAVVWIHDV